MNISSDFKELLFTAIKLGVQTHFFDIYGSELINPLISLEKDGTPERVAKKELNRKKYTDALPEVCVDTDWSSSGLWTEGRMIRYNNIAIPFSMLSG